uniref:Uncharacterized protein n=1 Tax=Timema bartmani TaxID=61472 RepID=A0A7R9EUA9_9NEOP|nr:unnamed protein product [Timema bartmani]
MNIRLEDVKRDPREIMAQEEREMMTMNRKRWKQVRLLTDLNPPEIEVERSWVHSGEGYEAQLVCIVHGEPAPEGKKHSVKLYCSSDPDLVATSKHRMDETNGIVPLDQCSCDLTHRAEPRRKPNLERPRELYFASECYSHVHGSRFGSQRHPMSFKPSPVTSSLNGSLRAFPPNKRRTFNSPYSRSRDVVRLDGLDVAT